MNEKLEKIRKLLAKAENPACPPPEAEALTEMATKLMAKYGIEQAMIDAARPADRARVENRRIVCTAPYAMEKRSLIHQLCEAMGLQNVRLTGEGAGATEIVHVFGFAVDMDRMEMLYTSLLLQSATAMREAEHTRPGYESIKAWRRSFLNGFAHAVGRRVREAEQAAKAEAQDEAPTGTSVALVVAGRDVEVRAAITEAYPRISTSRRILSGSGGGAGRAAGARANIGGTGISSGARRSVGA